MPNYSAKAIANEFLRRRTDSAWPRQMFIQKLAYMAHGWNLAINNAPLIGASPEAWDNGPVYRDIWHRIKEYGYKGPNWTLTDRSSGEPFSAPLTENERLVVEHVWKKYGQKSSNELSAMTHEPGTPWYKACFKGRNTLLDDRDIKQHYIDLALAGREQRAKLAD